MKTKSKKNLPLGISLLRLFYGINAFLFFVTTLIFLEYLDVVIFGKTMKAIPAFTIRLILMLIPLYLVFGFFYLRKEAYLLAIIYHLFFIINGILPITYYVNETLNIKPLLEISFKPEYMPVGGFGLFAHSFQLHLIQIISTTIGVFIIIYLLTKRRMFYLSNLNM